MTADSKFLQNWITKSEGDAKDDDVNDEVDSSFKDIDEYANNLTSSSSAGCSTLVVRSTCVNKKTMY